MVIIILQLQKKPNDLTTDTGLSISHHCLSNKDEAFYSSIFQEKTKEFGFSLATTLWFKKEDGRKKKFPF